MHVPCKRWKATHNDKWGPWHIKRRVLGCWYVFFLKLLFLLFNLTFYSFIGTKAAAWAKPSRSQAVTGGFGLAWGLTKPKPPQARPKPRLPGQAGPCPVLLTTWAIWPTTTASWLRRLTVICRRECAITSQKLTTTNVKTMKREQTYSAKRVKFLVLG